jgi:undecaprenyl-diphosphatase
MTILQSIMLGIIEGLTEFIPVSSTAHLLIGQTALQIPAGDTTFAYLVLVQLGALLALIVYFWKDLWLLIRAFFARPFSTPENRLAWYILIATVPAALIGFLLRHAVEALFARPLFEAAVRLFAAAILLALAEWLGKRARGIEAITWLDALIIGLFQILAVFPGASRSGATISGGMLRGLDRPAAARFAFLISIPIMLGAGGYQALDVMKLPDLGAFLPVIAVGFILAAIVGWFSVKWLLNYLNHHSLYIFAIYCAIVGTLALVASSFLA